MPLTPFIVVEGEEGNGQYSSNMTLDIETLLLKKSNADIL